MTTYPWQCLQWCYTHFRSTEYCVYFFFLLIIIISGNVMTYHHSFLSCPRNDIIRCMSPSVHRPLVVGILHNIIHISRLFSLSLSRYLITCAWFCLPSRSKFVLIFFSFHPMSVSTMNSIALVMALNEYEFREKKKTEKKNSCTLHIEQKKGNSLIWQNIILGKSERARTFSWPIVCQACCRLECEGQMNTKFVL